ncbi:hypothetical protein AURDEDRAFT_173680 [Auricularia subglabra TFB-10046 SS5]|nr:hypothetical protein AURDEDRAFT_173680 [Auricularia subglabra TFB-10046 SS5]
MTYYDREKGAPSPTLALTNTAIVDGGRPVASDIWIPPELLCRIARLLPYRDVCQAINVNGAWRRALLADTKLWTHIVVLFTQPNCRRWLSTIKTLVSRTKGSPMTLELECRHLDVYDGPAYNALDRVAHFLATCMPSMRSLSLAIPDCETFGWGDLLSRPAPLLEVFRIRILILTPNQLPSEAPKLYFPLFDDEAPRLRTVYMEGAGLPRLISDESSAFDNVVSLTYHTLHQLWPGDLDLGTVMPSLRKLTCTVRAWYDVEDGEREFLDELDELRLNVAPGMRAFTPQAEVTG